MPRIAGFWFAAMYCLCAVSSSRADDTAGSIAAQLAARTKAEVPTTET